MNRIETTSALYLKRLARELNRTTDGFYADFVADFVAGGCKRCNRARITKGRLEVRTPSLPGWFVPSTHKFCDAYGRNIVASTCV